MSVFGVFSQAAMGLKDRSTEVKHGLPSHLLGPVPLPTTGLESKVSPSHQALLQHLLQKEQMRQQKMLSSGKTPPHSSLSAHWWSTPTNSPRVSLPPRRPKLLAVTPPVPAGHEGASGQQSTKATQTPAPEQDPVRPAAAEHTGPTGHPAATPALSGETETVPAAGPHQQGTSPSALCRVCRELPPSAGSVTEVFEGTHNLFLSLC